MRTFEAKSILIAVLMLFISRAAYADVQALDCHTPYANLVIHIWIDQDTRDVTVLPTLDGKAVRAPDTARATISHQTYFWRDTFGDSRYAAEVIDRSTGEWTTSNYGGADGITLAPKHTYACALGSTPLPKTKF